MKEDVSFHGRKEREPRDSRCFVKEICPSNLSVLALLRCISNDQIDQIHFPYDILKSSNIGIRYLTSGPNIAKRWQIFE